MSNEPRFFDYTKPEEINIHEFMGFIIEKAQHNLVVQKLETQCIRAAAKQDFLSEEEMDDVRFFPNIHRGGI